MIRLKDQQGPFDPAEVARFLEHFMAASKLRDPCRLEQVEDYFLRAYADPAAATRCMLRFQAAHAFLRMLKTRPEAAAFVVSGEVNGRAGHLLHGKLIHVVGAMFHAMPDVCLCENFEDTLPIALAWAREL